MNERTKPKRTIIEVILCINKLEDPWPKDAFISLMIGNAKPRSLICITFTEPDPHYMRDTLQLHVLA